jgi:hypothetical protein
LIVYYDGYGYNFYYGDFGYYEYSLNDAPPGVTPSPVYYGGSKGEEEGLGWIAIPIIICCCFCSMFCFICRKAKVMDGEGGESEDTDMQDQF